MKFSNFSIKICFFNQTSNIRYFFCLFYRLSLQSLSHFTKSTLTVVENKIPDVSNLVKKIDFNTKVTEIEGKIPSITGLATNSGLSAVENKIPNVSS